MPDLDALTRAGDRRLRRRQTGLLAGGLAAAAVVVAAVAVPGLRGGSGDTNVVDLPDVAAVSWARGQEIHVGDETVEVGHEVNAYVRTSHGYVVADPDGNVWSVTGSGVDQVGTVSAKHPRLVADTEGSLAGWVDPSEQSPSFMVWDQDAGGLLYADGTHTSADMGELADEADPAYFYAIDGRTAYWRDARGAVAVDLDTGEVGVVEAKARNGFDIVAVEDGHIAFSRPKGTLVARGPDGAATMLRGAYGSMGAFSPDGQLLHRRRRRGPGVRRPDRRAGRARPRPAGSPRATSGSTPARS